MQTGVFENKLYYDDPRCGSFDAEVLSCAEDAEGFRLRLSCTGFYPGGGGQPADRGTVAGLSAEGCGEDDPGVRVHEYIEPGTIVHCTIDMSRRLGFMRRHSGEHIVSGLLHRHTGGGNVGFHMNESLVTLDWSLPLDAELLRKVERETMDVILDDRPVGIRVYPGAPEEIEYRAKRALSGEVRLVTIPGADTCACCGLHVARTGEIGIVRIVDAMHWKGGSRLTLLIGAEALEDAQRVAAQNREVGSLVSAKPYETAAGVRAVMAQNDALRLRVTELRRTVTALRAESLEHVPGALTLFEEGLEPEELRHLALALSEKREERVAVFTGTEEAGYRYCIAQRAGDVRPLTKAFNVRLSGRGGGSAVLTQGSVPAGRAAIEEALRAL